MKRMLAVLMLAAIPGFSQTSPRADSVTSPGAALKLVAKQFSFTEGPAADKKGNVYFTDQPNDKIWKVDTEGKLSLFMDKTGRSNGLYFDARGNLISCADENNEIWSIRPDKKVTVLLTREAGKRLNGPNDLWITPKGDLYFTDPYYQRDYWERKKPELPGQYVYFLPKGKKEAQLVDSTVVKPNGIIGTPDGKHLYVADIQANKTYQYDIAADGRLNNRRLFTAQGSDGMTIDERGNIYLTGKGVWVYNPQGTLIQTIPVPAGWVGNVCFGGKDRRTLFITASEAVYTMDMQVKGAK